MNNRVLIASALAAAVAAPSLASAQGPPATPASRPRSATASPRPARTTAPRPATTPAPAPQGQCRPEGLGLRPCRLLRPHRQRQQDTEGLITHSAGVAMTTTGTRVPTRSRRRPQAPASRRGRGHPPSCGWLEIHPENFLANPHATELLLESRRLPDLGPHGRGLHRQRQRNRPRAPATGARPDRLSRSGSSSRAISPGRRMKAST